MGAWDFGPFDNDDASDWLYDLEESSDLSLLANAFRAVTDAGGDYLEAPDCCNALAAAEIVAALLGNPIAKLPDNARAWVDAHSGLDASSLVPAAQAAIQQIRSKSELKELWEESDDARKWRGTLDDVSDRLSA